MRISVWSSDVCSSDLPQRAFLVRPFARVGDAPHAVELVVAVQRPTVVEAREQRLAVRRNRFNDGFAQRLFEAFERGKCEPGRYQALADDGLGKARSEEHTSELQSLMRISYAVFCLKKKKQHTNHTTNPEQN